MPLGSDIARNAILQATLGSAQHASLPTTLYLALFAGDPAGSPAGVELSGPGYARAPVAAATAWGAAVAGVKSTVVDVNLGPSTGAWTGTATHLALMDAATGGNRWDQGPLGSAITVSGSGTTVTFLAGMLSVTEA